LGGMHPIDQVILWNRSECCGERLNGVLLRLLDEDRKEVWGTIGSESAPLRQDFRLGDAELINLAPAGPSSKARERRRAAIDRAIDDGVRYLIDVQQSDGSWGHGTKEWGPGASGLALYTLLKQGVPRDHEAIRRGFVHLRGTHPRKTYSVATSLLALCALGDEQDNERIEELLELLIEWQEAPGGDGAMLRFWGYPSGVGDLSNTQFAALALRAALHHGVKIPKNVWVGLIAATMEHKGESREGDPAFGDDKRYPPMIAGFRYRTNGGVEAEKGSMVTAGLSILSIAYSALDGKIPGKYRRGVIKAKEEGLNWLAEKFSSTGNPGAGNSWFNYYLYGIERVGGLYETDMFGTHDWYWKGAAELLKRQKAEGHWDNIPDTAFALLFLSRATSPTSGLAVANSKDLWVSEGEGHALDWRIIGDGDTVTMFVTGFSDEILEKHAFDVEGAPGIRVQEVRYLLDGEVVLTMPGSSTEAWTDQRFTARHKFLRPSKAVVTCEVSIMDPYAIEGDDLTITVAGGTLEIKARRGQAPWMYDAARATNENLLRRSRPRLTSSSDLDENSSAKVAMDQLVETRWICDPNDAVPELTVELERKVRGNLLLLYGLERHDREAGQFDRVETYEIYFDNDKEPHIVTRPDDPLEPARLLLERPIPIRRIRIRIAERRTGSPRKGQAGFAEIAFLVAE
ncbi:MAG: hypothetical protein ACI9K5_000345, partial [Gammaproteobacteria bacterium]